jgi:hypothetical protein
VRPPSPEDDSAHAVVATASATILTNVFGPVAFTETSATLNLSSLTLNEGGPYSTTVRNAYGVFTTPSAMLQVVDRVTISTHPQSSAVGISSNVTFRVSAVSLLPIIYRWRFKDAVLPGSDLVSVWAGCGFHGGRRLRFQSSKTKSPCLETTVQHAWAPVSALPPGAGLREQNLI